MAHHKFWSSLDRLLSESEIEIDRPKGTIRDDLVYPVDYGYLKGTRSPDFEGIDVFVGSMECPAIDAIICTVNMYKKESEIKILFGCSEAEKKAIQYMYSEYRETLQGMLIHRDEGDRP